MSENPALLEILVQSYLNGITDYSEKQISESKKYLNNYILKKDRSKLTDVEKQIVTKWDTDLSIPKNDRMVILGGPNGKKWKEWKDQFEDYFDKAQFAKAASQKQEEVQSSPGSQNQSEAEMNINMNVNFKEETKMENKENAQAQQEQAQGQEKGILEKAWDNKGTIIGAAAAGAAVTIGVQKLMSNDKSSYGSTMGDVAEAVSQFRGMFRPM